MGRKNADGDAGQQKKKQAAAPLGCLGNLFQLLEFHRRLRCPYVGHHSTPHSSPLQRRLPPVRVVVSKRVTKEDGVAEGERAETPYTPGVVARLMGLDSLPADVPNSSSAAVRWRPAAPSAAVKLQRTRSAKMDSAAVDGPRGPPKKRLPSRRPVLHPKLEAANSSADVEDCGSWPLGCSWSLPETPRSSSARRSSCDGVEGRLSLPLYSTGGGGKENVDAEFERICEVVSETNSSSLIPASAFPTRSRRRMPRTTPPSPPVAEPPRPTRDGAKSLRGGVNMTGGEPHSQGKKENMGKDSDRAVSRPRRPTPQDRSQQVKPYKGDHASTIAVRTVIPSCSVTDEAPTLSHASRVNLTGKKDNRSRASLTNCQMKRLNCDKYNESIKTSPCTTAQRSQEPSEPSVCKRAIAGPTPVVPVATPTSAVDPSPTPVMKLTEKQTRPVSLSSYAMHAKVPPREYVKTVTFVKDHGAANRKTPASLLPAQQTPRCSSWNRLAEWYYVKNILHHAGIQHASNTIRSVKWHSSSHPIDPIVFHKLELSMIDDDDARHHLHRPFTRGSMRHRCNRKLLFHLVNEILVELLDHSKPWCSTMGISKRHEGFSIVNGDVLLKQLWGRVQAFASSQYHLQQNIKELVCRDMSKDKSEDPCVVEEIEKIVVSIERSIFNSLISELL